MAYIHNKKINKDFRKLLRNNMTEEEVILWAYLKNKRWGVKFRRQYGIGPYVADFYCREKKLVIELDGSQHLDDREHDQIREDFMKLRDITTLRFWNQDVRKNLDGVIMKILSAIS